MKARLVILFSGTLVLAMLSVPVIAADFHALGALQGVSPTALQDSELASTEGGARCRVVLVFRNSHGQITWAVCLAAIIGGTQGASFAVANELPVKGANFLQVTGGL